MNYKSLYPRLVWASDGVGLRSQIHLVARLRAATSVDTKCSKLLGNKGLCGKLAFYQLNYSRSMIPFKYRRIRGFTATTISTSLRIQILPLAIYPPCFARVHHNLAWLEAQNGQ